MMQLQSIGAIQGLPAHGQSLSGLLAKPAGEGGSSGDLFTRAMDQVASVDDSQHAANDMMAELAAGRKVDLHETFIALEQADIQLRTLVSVRNRVVSAYEQVMSMAI